MTRERIGALVLGGVALVALATYSLSGEAAPEPLVVAEAPLRVAAGTPEAGWSLAALPVQVAQTGAEEAEAAPLPAPVPDQPALTVDDDPCGPSFEVFAEDGAMLGLTLLAPCRAGERVVLRHGGLAIAMQTLATGSLFASLPAMEAGGAVVARFDDGTEMTAAAAVPELAGLRRIAVQWQDADRFAVNGFEGGAGYGEAGHQTAQNGGVLALGDPALSPALLAEVYTLPDPGAARITVEAEVTDATCGRELLGEMVYSADGAAQASELTLAMPECDALGGFVVLNNPLPDMTLATAE